MAITEDPDQTAPLGVYTGCSDHLQLFDFYITTPEFIIAIEGRQQQCKTYKSCLLGNNCFLRQGSTEFKMKSIYTETFKENDFFF